MNPVCCPACRADLSPASVTCPACGEPAPGSPTPLATAVAVFWVALVGVGGLVTVIALLAGRL